MTMPTSLVVLICLILAMPTAAQTSTHPPVWQSDNADGKTTRIYHSTDIRGPWQYHDLNEQAFDPGLFFDDDGTPYLFTSGGWDGTVTLKTLSPNLDRILHSRKIFYVKGIEGSKALKINGWYYLFNALPARLALMCSRAKSLDGPWETIEVLDTPRGGHQGALVDLPDGSWYGFVMRDAGPIGRVTNISPITWKDEWPLWGEPPATGRVPARAKKPIPGQQPIPWPRSADFNTLSLPLTFQWNHNPDDTRWSLTQRSGFLRLQPTTAPDFWNARNTLTHKGWGPVSCLAVTFDISNLAPDAQTGLGTLGKSLATLSIHRDATGRAQLSLSTGIESKSPLAATATADLATATRVHLALEMNFITARGRFAYSLDGSTWTQIGQDFPLMFDWATGTFQGQQFAIFCFAPTPTAGHVDIDNATFIRLDRPTP